jgi:hypothetical protein
MLAATNGRNAKQEERGQQNPSPSDNRFTRVGLQPDKQDLDMMAVNLSIGRQWNNTTYAAWVTSIQILS